MFVENFLLPRFLILELVFACHWFEYTKAVDVLTCEVKKDVSSRREPYGFYIDTDKPSKKGVFGLKEFLNGDHSKSSENLKAGDNNFDSTNEGAVGVKKFLESEDSESEISMPKKGLYELEEIIDSENKLTYKFSAVNTQGVKALKNYLMEDIDLEEKTCKFSLRGQNWKFPPLLFNQQGNPILPADDANKTDMEVAINHDEEIIIFCPGKKVNNSPHDRVVVTCHGDDKFLLNSTLVDIDQLGCVGNPAEAELLQDQTGRCGPSGKGMLSQIGFVLNEKMYPVISVCHFQGREQTFYSNHTLYGKFLHYKSIYERRTSFREGRLYFKSISANDAYKQAKQKRLFSALLNQEDSILDYYDPGDGLYLARGHLAPKADLLYTDWQEASYMYSNVVPQWQRINNGNWGTVEVGVRAAARRRGVTFQVFTGTIDVFKVNGREVNLVEDKIPVPEYLWKMIVDTRTGENIVFVTLNNPFVKHATRGPDLCLDVCDETRWNRVLKTRTITRKGYTICCKPSDLREKVPWLPKAESTKDLLIF